MTMAVAVTTYEIAILYKLDAGLACQEARAMHLVARKYLHSIVVETRVVLFDASHFRQPQLLQLQYCGGCEVLVIGRGFDVVVS
jgi:hypothetical protein